MKASFHYNTELFNEHAKFSKIHLLLISLNRASQLTIILSSVPQPHYFFRVQSESSFTKYKQDIGFFPKTAYCMDYPYWVNKEKVQSHLTWGDRPEQTTPFVSVFDNLRLFLMTNT